MDVLLNRPQQMQGECLSSYFYRSLKDNYMDTISPCLNKLGIKLSQFNNNQFSDESLIKMKTLLNLDQSIQDRMTLNPFQKRLGSWFNRIVMKNKIKFCPLCSHDVIYHKTIWWLTPITICLEHAVLLKDYCDRCRKSLCFKELMNGICKCGFMFKHSSIQNLDEDSWIYQSQTEIQDRINDSYSGLFCSSLLDYLILLYHTFYILEDLPSFIADDVKKIKVFNNKKGAKYSNLNWAISFANAFWVYKDFPTNFYKALDSFQFKTKKTQYEQRPRFEEILDSPSYLFIRDAYSEYWIEQVNFGFARKDISLLKKDKSLLEKRTYISQEEIQAKYKITSEKIHLLESNKKINMLKVQRGAKKLNLIDKESIVDALKKESSFC